MYMRNKAPFLRNIALVTLSLQVAVFAQQKLDPRSSFKIDLPKDSPVTLMSADFGESNASSRGGAIVLDLHSALSLRNSDARRIRGVTLMVLAQEFTPGGRASVTVPSLNVSPGEVFPIRIDLRLLRPLGTGTGALVQVGLDGVLFDDLSFYGPNKLNSRRSMTVYEMEARRDRQHLKSALAANGAEGLRHQILASLSDSNRPATGVPSLSVQMTRGGRSTNVENEHPVQFAFLRFPDSPVEPMDGLAKIVGNEARAPRVEVRNRSDRAIRYLEIGWILEDQRGHNYLAGTVPAELSLAPGQTGQVLQDTSFKFSQRPGQPFAIQGITGFVSSVEFNDGKIWIPSRTSLGKAQLRDVMGASAEEQRLVQIYQKKGLQALIEELKKF